MSEWCGVDGCNESVVFGSVARSDAEEEEELSSWRLSPINTSMTLTTEIGGVFSPEISCIVPDPSYENQVYQDKKSVTRVSQILNTVLRFQE